MTIGTFRIPIASACLMAALSTSVEAQERAFDDLRPRFEVGECPFDTSRIDVEGLRCGYLTVPENRETDNGRTLRLAVAIAEPPGATGDPVVLLPGGPGLAPLPGFIERLRRWVPPDRTVVVFDPRGTGYSGPVMCPELSETASAIAALDLTSEQAALLQRGGYLACRDRLLRQGIELGAYNSTTVALDLKDLREALGYERWNIMSGSYGVPFAHAAMRLDSAGIRSAVLAIGPGPVITDLLRRDVPFFARALERVFRACAAEAACAEAFPDLERAFYRAYASLLEEPLTVSVDPGEFHDLTFTVNAQDFVRMIYWELTSETGVAYVPGLIGAFRDRDADVVRQMVARGYGGLTSNSSRMGTSVMCYDAHTPESRREWEEAAAPFPPALADIEYFLIPCEDWSEERASVEERGPHRSEIPTLVITGEYDPMNPPITGEEHLRWLTNGYHVVIPGMGHMPTARSAACWGGLIEQFVEDPAQRPDDSCTEELPEVEFGPDLPGWAQPDKEAHAPADTTRYTIIINGHRQGERRMWQEASDTWRYEHDGDAYHFPRTERLVLDSRGYPLAIDIEGQRIVWDRWFERYERSDRRARWMAHARSSLGPEWSRSLDEGEGEAEVSGPAYYAAFHPVHDPGVLARLLLQQPDRTVPLLPDGTARLEPVGERWVEANGMRRRVRLFAIHGLDLQPSYVWLDDDGATFADEWSVLAGWEAAFPELRAASDAALAEHHRRLADDLVPPARQRPLVIRGARLFDPERGAISSGTTIIVDGVRISAVGPDGALDLPPGAEVVDAGGRIVLPGLWDMHAHHGFPGPYFELIAPLYLAGGITVARDMGMPMEPMLSLRRRVQAGDAVGPRLLMAGWVGGAGGRPTGTLVGNPAEATAAVDRFAELGYVQIKIYGDLPHELVPVVIERAKQHGLRVSGEVPTGMTAREAVAHGYEEIQHIDGLLLPLADSLLTEFFAQPTPAGLQEVNEALAELKPDSRAVQELIRLLAAEGVAVDPTLTVFATQGMEPPEWVARVAGRFPSQARRRILDRHLFGYWPLTPLWDEILGNMTALVGALHDAGVPVLAGTDTEMAASDLHQELALYVEGGIPAPEVLTLATLGAARIMGMGDELGSVEPGKLADLILVDGDPTTDIDDLRRVVMVVKDGRVYDPAAIYRARGIEP